MYSDGLLKLPLFTIQKNFKILLTVYSLSPHTSINFSYIQKGCSKVYCCISLTTTLVSETVRYSFLTAYGITKRIILIMIEYSVRDFVLCGCSVLLILASDDTAHAALLIAYIMVIRLGILAVGADQSQSTDIADDVAAVVLLCYDFPVFIIEELH